MSNTNRSKRDARPQLRVAAWPLAVACALYQGMAAANPAGPDVVAGQVAITQTSPSTLQVQQGTHSAIVNWQQFSIGAGEQVRFEQPSASAAILNRVVGQDASDILGNLSANGRVFLVNPQGVMFGPGAQVDVGSLVASTLDIADQDFLDGNHVFLGAGNSRSEVVNQGGISSAAGGFVVLAGAHVRNEGVIEARLGDVALLSGSALTLTIDDGGLVDFVIDDAAIAVSAGVSNFGEIIADGGRVLLGARLAQALIGTAVNQSGRIQAHSIVEHEGAVFLQGEGGSISQRGTIDLSRDAGANGGELHVQSSETLVVGRGSIADGCRANLCEADLENWLGNGATVSLTSGTEIALDALDGNTLSGRSAADPGNGGNLFLVAVGGGDVNFDPGDTIDLDGTFSASADGRLQVGSIDAAGSVVLTAGTDIDVGDITVRDAVDPVVVDDSFGTTVSGARLLLSTAGGDIRVHGDVDIHGALDAIESPGYQGVLGAYAGFFTPGQLILNGTVKLEGVVNSVTGDVGQVRGAELQLGFYDSFGAFGTGFIHALQSVTVTGRLGGVTGGTYDGLTGASLLAFSAGSQVFDGKLQVDGKLGLDSDGNAVSVTEVLNDNSNFTPLDANGALLQLVSYGESLEINQGIEVDGTVGTIATEDRADVSGAYVTLGLRDDFGPSTFELTVRGDIDIFGRIRDAGGGAGSDLNFVAGAVLSAASFYDQSFNGRVEIDGGVAALNDVGIDGLRAFGALLSTEADASITFSGPLVVTGRLAEGEVLTAGGTYDFGATAAELFGAYALISAKEAGNVSNVNLDAGAAVTGRIGTIQGRYGGSINAMGAGLEATAEEFAVIADSGVVRIRGTTSIDGDVGGVAGRDEAAGLSGARDASVVGAGLYLGDGFLTNVIDVLGPIDVQGHVGTVDLSSSAIDISTFSVLGADVFMRSFVDVSLLNEKGTTPSGAPNPPAVTAHGRVDAAHAGIALDPYVTGSSVVIGTASEGSINLDGVDAHGEVGRLTTGVFDDGSLATFATVRGVDFLLDAFGNFSDQRGVTMGRTLNLSGSIGSIDAGHFLDAAGVNALVLSFGRAAIEDGIAIRGTIGSVTAGFAPFLTGSRLYVDTFFGGNTSIAGGVIAFGEIGSITADEYISAYANSLYLNATDGLSIGPDANGTAIQADGRINAVASSTGELVDPDIVASYVTINADSGSVDIHGSVTASGTVPVLTIADAIPGTPAPEPLSGADIIRNRMSGGNSLLEIPDFTLAALQQPEGNSAVTSQVSVYAGTSVSFDDISGQNIFINFSEESFLGDASINASGYLDLFSPFLDPVLHANSLSLRANNMLISANLGAETLTVDASGILFVGLAALTGRNASIAAREMIISEASMAYAESLTLTTTGGLLFATNLLVDSPDATVRLNAGTSLFLDQSELSARQLTLSAPEYLILFESEVRATEQLRLSAITPAAATVLKAEPSPFDSNGVIFIDELSSLDGGSLSMAATTTILSQGKLHVGRGTVADGADAGMLSALGKFNPSLVPDATQPNASFVAPFLGIANLSLDGDYLHFNSNFTYLTGLTLAPNTLVHVDPLAALPVFAESVTLDRSGLADLAAQGRVASRDNRILPTLGSLQGAFGSEFLDFSSFILQSGLADTTVVVGGSDYTAGIQIADQLIIDVLPSRTNFAFMTSSSILLTQPIRTNGQFVILNGKLETDPDVFYKLVREQIETYYASIDLDTELRDGEVEEKTRNEEDCEK